MPTRGEIVHSESRPEGYYYAILPPQGEVFLVPAPEGSRFRALDALDRVQKTEVVRLDRLYRMKYKPDWVEAERRKDRERHKARRAGRGRPTLRSPSDVATARPGQKRNLKGLNEQTKRQIRAEWQQEYDRERRKRSKSQGECCVITASVSSIC